MNARELGSSLDNWTPPEPPDGAVLEGRFARLEPLNVERHAADLFAAYSEDKEGEVWDYLPYGPFPSLASYHRWMRGVVEQPDPFFYAIFNKEAKKWCGVASYLRVQPAAGSIEVGHINYAPALQRTRAGTEAMYLMMKAVFDAGYRRYEWKCNALNSASRRSAERFGFSFEGVFRQAAVVKGRNRDTAWFAAIDSEWPDLEAAYKIWLSPSNFTLSGRQIDKLWDLTRPIRVTNDPARRKAQ